MSVRDSLINEVACTADWRREKAAEYPDDERNNQAAALLDSLAAELDGLEASDALWTKYAECWEGETGGVLIAEDISTFLREVGFSTFPSSGREFLDELLHRLTC
jgi:hypothetical protein